MNKIGFATVIAAGALAAAADGPIDRMLDSKLTAAQRNDACYGLRGSRAPESIAAFQAALRMDAVRACAATNLRKAEAAEVLRDALSDEKPEIRAVAASELGELERPEMIPALEKAAADRDPLVAANAVQGLTKYHDRVALPALLAIAEKGGAPGMLALSRAAQFGDARVTALARKLLDSADVPVKLTAIRVIGEVGDRSDLAALDKLAADNRELRSAGRGFGLMPPVQIGRAARIAIERIKARS